MITLNENPHSYAIQEMPVFTKAFLVTISISPITPDRVRFNVACIHPENTLIDLGEIDRNDMLANFGGNSPLFKRYMEGFVRQRNIAKLEMIVVQLDRDAYMPVDSSGTKFEMGIMSLLVYNGSEVVAATPGDLGALCAQLGMLPPQIIPLPLSSIKHVEDGLIDRFNESLLWLEAKPGQILTHDTKPTFKLRCLASKDIFDGLTNCIDLPIPSVAQPEG